MSDEHHLSERDRAWLEHTRNCGTGCLSTYAKANGLDVQRLYAAKSRLKSKGVLGELSPSGWFACNHKVARRPSLKATAGCICATAWCSK